MLVDSLIHRRWKDALLTSIPVLLIIAIVLPYVNKGILDRFILEFNAATWSVSRVNLGNFWFRDYVAPVFTSVRPMSFFHFFHAYALAFIAVAGYLAISSSKVDWRLGVYSILMFIAIMVFGYSNGIVRYASFIFPVWLCIKMKNPVLVASIMALFYIHSLVLWHQFLWAPYPM